MADAVEHSGYQWAENFSALERAADRHYEGQISLAEAVKDAARDIQSGLIVGAALLIVGPLIAAAREAVRTFEKQVLFFALIRVAEERFPYITFRFIVSFMSFCGLDRDEAHDMLSDWITLGIIKRYRRGKKRALRINWDSDLLQGWLQAVRNYYAKYLPAESDQALESDQAPQKKRRKRRKRKKGQGKALNPAAAQDG